MYIEPTITLYGDARLAKRLVGLGKARLRILEDSMTYMELKQDRSVLKIQPGIEIQCSVVFNTKTIKIYVKPSGEVEGERISYVEEVEETFYWHADITGAMAEAYPMDVYTDSSRRVYVIGAINSVVTNYEVFIAIYNKNGRLLAQRTLGLNSTIEFGTNIIVDSSGNIYVLFDAYSDRSDTYFDTALAKYSSDLTILWQRDIGVIYSSVYSTGIILSSTSVYVSGWLRDYAHGAEPDRQQGYIFKFKQSNGLLAWQKRIGGYDVAGPPITNGDLTFIEGIAIDTNVDIYGIGRFYYGSYSTIGAPLIIKLSSSGAFVWAKHLTYTVSGKAGNAIWGVSNSEVSDGIYALCAEKDPVDSISGVFTAIVTKFDSSGNAITDRYWKISVPYSNSEVQDDFIPRMATDRLGNIYTLVNTFTTTKGVLLVKHNANRELIWSRLIEHSTQNSFSIPGIRLDAQGDILLFGSLDDDSDYITIKFPRTGGFLGAKGDLVITDPIVTPTYSLRFTIVNLTGSDIEVKNGGFSESDSFSVSNTPIYLNETTKFLKRKTVKTVPRR